MKISKDSSTPSHKIKKIIRRLFKICYSWTISFFIFFILLEIGLYILSCFKDVPYEIPIYRPPQESFYADRNKDFGVWHKPNSSYQHRKSCFDVEYQTNSYGARDKERTKKTKHKRVVVLGDSFIEGFGIKKEERLTDLLEKKTGLEHLNFGTSGDFGTTQQSILYKTLAIQFEHDYVLIGFLPANDFKDDDLSYGMKIHSKRYRPYYKGQYPNYRLTYFDESNFGKTVYYRTTTEKIKSYLRNYTFSYNMYMYFKIYLIYKNREKQKKKGQYIYSGYFDYTQEELLKARYSIENIVNISNKYNKKVFLFTIPSESDFLRSGIEGNSPLYLEFKKMSNEIGFEYIDLLKEMIKKRAEGEKFFHSCDSHWNANGNKVASEILLKLSYN